MRLDNLPKPETLWYEDQDENTLTPDEWGVQDHDPEKIWQQHVVNLVAQRTVYGTYIKAKWPIRFLKWIISNLPYSWKGQGPYLYQSSASVNCVYPMVKYLVDKSGWEFTTACIALSELCEDCLNDCLDECNSNKVKTRSGTSCKSCEYINPERLEKRRVWCCYRTLKLGGDVAKAWKDRYPNSGIDELNNFRGNNEKI